MMRSGAQAADLPEEARRLAASECELTGEILGRGAGWPVLAGVHRRTGGAVAVKVIRRPVSSDGRVDEARLLAGLDHPHVVRTVDIVDAPGLRCVLMERMDGRSLAAYMPAPAAWACAAAVATGEAVGYAHECGILHLDCKPTNVLVGRDGALKLSDFGIAVAAGEQRQVRAGTRGFMPPEQAAGDAVSPAADVYALAATWYALLAGQPPSSPTAADRARLVERGLPPVLADLCLRGLALRPSRRPAADRFTAELVHGAAEQWGGSWLERTGLRVALRGRALTALRLMTFHPGVQAPQDEGWAGTEAWAEALPTDIGGEVVASVEAPSVRPRGPTPGRSVDTSPPGVGRSTALTGREEECARLREALAPVEAGRGVMVDIVGPAGIGKSAVIAEVFRDRSGGWITSAGRPGMPAYGLARDLLVAAGIPHWDGGLPTAEQLGELASGAPDLSPWLPLVAEVLGVGLPATEQIAATAPEFLRLRREAALCDALLALLGEQGPSVVAVEDLDLVDEASRSLLTVLAARATHRPFGLIIARRPDTDRLPTADDVAVTQHEIGPLGDAEIRRIAIDAAGALALGDREVAAIARRSAGNPLLASRLAALSTGRDRALPGQLADVVAAGLRDVRPRARRQLFAAAVLGAQFAPAAVAEMLDDDRLADGRAWGELHLFLRRADDNRLAFQHDLLWEAVYGAIDPRQRRRLHGAAARLPAITADETALARHLLRGGDLATAVPIALRTADRAFAVGAHTDGAALLELAVEAGRHARPALEPGRLGGIERRLADAYSLASRLVQADALYVRALRHSHDPVERAAITTSRGEVAEKAGDYRRALRLHRRAEHLAAGSIETSAVEVRLRAALGRALALSELGASALGPAAAALEEALRHATELNDPVALGRAHLQLEWVEGVRGRTDASAIHRDAALALFQDAGDHLRLGHYWLNTAVSSFEAGEWRDVLPRYDRAEVEYELAGDVIGLAQVDNNRAEILTIQGHLERAAAYLDDADRNFKAAGYRLGIAMVESGRSRIALYEGRHVECRDRLTRARTLFSELEADDYVLDTDVRAMELAVFEGRDHQAVELGQALRSRLADAPPAVIGYTVERLAAMALLALGRTDEAILCCDLVLAGRLGPSPGPEPALTSALLSSIDASRPPRTPDALAAYGIVRALHLHGHRWIVSDRH